VALGVMRQNLARALETDLPAALLIEAEGQWKAGDSADAKEGIQAFLGKRKAEFTGR
jgi:2-(1,2-epoxy-1,2-dihydrophenyl)acetyl-CoA isomerase